MEKKIPLRTNFKLYLKARFEVERHRLLCVSVNMSYGKCVTEWYCYNKNGLTKLKRGVHKLSFVVVNLTITVSVS